MWHEQLPPRFILWKSVPDLPPKKPRKVPCDASGNPTDPMNPNGGFFTYWDAVKAAGDLGYNVGWTLPDDGWFLLDFDDCWDDQSNNWDMWSQQLAAQFPNAAMERSINGRGIHIVGKCDGSKMFDRRNKSHDNRLEFYYKQRFIALGDCCMGDPNIDWTSTLLRVVPQRPSDTRDAIDYTGPVPEYTGPADDQQLITKMLNAAGSMGAVMGDKASFRELWEGNPGRLAEVFPSPSGDLWDRSSADAALMSHLAFWTGKDFDRMDRLFRQSALCRDKYMARADYRNNTITGAIRNCTSVYTMAPTMSDKQEARQTASFAAGELLTVQEQIDYFQGCTYVTHLNQILTPSGVFMSQAQFKARYGGYEFIMKADGTKPTSNAWEAFTENKVHKFPKADKTTFRPDIPFGVILDDVTGTTSVNTWLPNVIEQIPGDVSLFLDLVKRLIPDHNDRAVLLAYMAAVAQYPGKKFLWAPVIIGSQGNGKSTLINILQYVIDGIVQGINDDATKYSLAMTAQHIDDRFNGSMQDKVLVVVHEMHTDSFKDQRARQDYLKTLITEPSISIERKGVDKFNARNVANFFFCSNHRDAVRLEESERRFAVFYTAQQKAGDVERDGMGGQYFPNLWQWLRSGGFQCIAYYLATYQIPHALDPTQGAQRAPVTTSHRAAVWESRSHAEQIILQAIECQEPGFIGGYVSTIAIKRFFESEGEKSPYGRALAHTMRNLGFVGGMKSSKMVMQENGRPRIWCRPELDTPSVAELTDKYCIAQGYPAAPGLTIVKTP